MQPPVRFHPSRMWPQIAHESLSLLLLLLFNLMTILFRPIVVSLSLNVEMRMQTAECIILQRQIGCMHLHENSLNYNLKTLESLYD